MEGFFVLVLALYFVFIYFFHQCLKGDSQYPRSIVLVPTCVPQNPHDIIFFHVIEGFQAKHPYPSS